jgi:CheY-like chemotaxis protein
MPRTLLVIDDDRDIRLVAKTSLELVGGFHVIVADSGHRGLAFANKARPDAILLDLMMHQLHNLLEGTPASIKKQENRDL